MIFLSSDAAKQGGDGADQASVDGVTPEFKEAMDSYGAFFDEYVAFMKEYRESGNPASMMAEYGTYMQQYAETMSAISEIDKDTLSEADALYPCGSKRTYRDENGGAAVVGRGSENPLGRSL